MIHIGKSNKLRVSRITDAGAFLSDEDKNEVLLPASHISGKLNQNDKLEVFVYADSDKQLLASTKIPVAQIGEFVCLRVNSVNDFGAFLQWGLEKDLFVPMSEQKHNMLPDNYYVVFIYLDEVSGRIVASSKLDKFVEKESIKLEGGQEVEIMIAEESDLGYSCIINGTYKGLVYHNDVYQDLFVGDELTAYVKLIRDDKLVDISLQKSGFKNVLSATEVILDYLESNNGFLDLHDKSSPEEIALKFNMSKATFKKSIGVLYRHRKVLIKPEGVYLVKSEEAPTEETENL